MNYWLFCVVGFAFLMALNPDRRKALFSERTGLGRYALREIFADWLEVFGCIVLLLCLYFFAFELWLPYSEDPVHSLCFLPAAYFLTSWRKRSRFFLVTVTGISFFIMSYPDPGPLENRLVQAFGLSTAAMVFQMLVLGLRQQLLLLTPPKSLEGIPSLFLSTAILTLGLCSIQGIVP